jgi:hypothetical protein
LPCVFFEISSSRTHRIKAYSLKPTPVRHSPTSSEPHPFLQRSNEGNFGSVHVSSF